MSQNTYTHKALADLLNVSETTVKSYRRKFPGCFPIASQGKPIRFTSEAAAVALRIREFFELGMSVEEVGHRLAGEFEWFSAPVGDGLAKETGTSKSIQETERNENAPELAQGVSSMARSLVSMLQQQKTMLTRMESIEAQLDELGLSSPVDAEGMRTKRQEETRQKEERLESRLNTLDDTTRELANTVNALARELNRFLGKREKAAQDWKRIRESAEEPGNSESLHENRVEGASGSNVVSLRRKDDQHFTAPAGTGETVGPRPSAEPPAEPPRALLGLSLVVRTGEGRYISAGPRGRGRFSINDLKARLIYGYTPPYHFVLSWEQHGQGWWLKLEQNSLPQEDTGTPRSLHLMLMEMPEQGGGTVAEILQLKNNGQAVHPAEICAIIDSLGS